MTQNTSTLPILLDSLSLTLLTIPQVLLRGTRTPSRRKCKNSTHTNIECKPYQIPKCLVVCFHAAIEKVAGGTMCMSYTQSDYLKALCLKAQACQLVSSQCCGVFVAIFQCSVGFYGHGMGILCYIASVLRGIVPRQSRW